MSALQPFQGRWNKTLAAHLLSRAGFGSLPDEIDRATAAGMEKTVDALLTLRETVNG